MNRKADLSLTTIIVAAIGLIVLIVLIAIFTGKIGFFSDDLASCTSKGGSCISGTCEGATVHNTDCAQTCCIVLGSGT